jgi:hypothetical protein
MKLLPRTLAALSLAVTAGAVEAEVLGPTKPSDLVTLTTFNGTQCGKDPIGRTLDHRQNPDGTISPFAIPSGKVFVVTGLNWTQGNTGGVNKAEILFLHSLTPSGVIFPMVIAHDNGSGDGRAGGSMVVSGVIFKSGQTMCVSVNTGNIGSAIAVVHGFLDRNR